MRSYTLHSIFKFVSYKTLSSDVFTTNLDWKKIPKDIYEPLEIREWREVVIEKIKALEKKEACDVIELLDGKIPIGCKLQVEFYNKVQSGLDYRAI